MERVKCAVKCETNNAVCDIDIVDREREKMSKSKKGLQLTAAV